MSLGEYKTWNISLIIILHACYVGHWPCNVMYWLLTLPLWIATSSCSNGTTFISHLFGLYHTFEGGCTSSGDGIPDTPTNRSSNLVGCPGLLPYNKDRDLFDSTLNTTMNFGNVSFCDGVAVCSGGSADTCAACCSDCRFYDSNNIYSFSEDDIPGNQACCQATQPNDSCSTFEGIDPKTNVMAYVSMSKWCFFITFCPFLLISIFLHASSYHQQTRVPIIANMRTHLARWRGWLLRWSRKRIIFTATMQISETMSNVHPYPAHQLPQVPTVSIALLANLRLTNLHQTPRHSLHLAVLRLAILRLQNQQSCARIRERNET